MSHKYRVGEAVDYVAEKAVKRQFKVVQVMPVEFPSTDWKYRIKCDAESFERVVWEYQLSPSLVPDYPQSKAVPRPRRRYA